jgi:hypothetical protein
LFALALLPSQKKRKFSTSVGELHTSTEQREQFQKRSSGTLASSMMMRHPVQLTKSTPPDHTTTLSDTWTGL